MGDMIPDGMTWREQGQRADAVGVALDRLIAADSPDDWDREDVITVVLAAAAKRDVLTSVTMVSLHEADPDETPAIRRVREAVARMSAIDDDNE